MSSHPPRSPTRDAVIGWTIYAQDPVQYGASSEIATFLDPGGERSARRWCARLNSLATTKNHLGATIPLPDDWYWVEKSCPILGDTCV